MRKQKPVPITVKREYICEGVWRETMSDGSTMMVADLTSALWRYKAEDDQLQTKRKADA